jgi:hypothetical protein
MRVNQERAPVEIEADPCEVVMQMALGKPVDRFVHSQDSSMETMDVKGRGIFWNLAVCGREDVI